MPSHYDQSLSNAGLFSIQGRTRRRRFNQPTFSVGQRTGEIQPAAPQTTELGNDRLDFNRRIRETQDPTLYFQPRGPVDPNAGGFLNLGAGSDDYIARVRAGQNMTVTGTGQVIAPNRPQFIDELQPAGGTGIVDPGTIGIVQRSIENKLSNILLAQPNATTEESYTDQFNQVVRELGYDPRDPVVNPILKKYYEDFMPKVVQNLRDKRKAYETTQLQLAVGKQAAEATSAITRFGGNEAFRAFEVGERTDIVNEVRKLAAADPLTDPYSLQRAHRLAALYGLNTEALALPPVPGQETAAQTLATSPADPRAGQVTTTEVDRVGQGADQTPTPSPAMLAAARRNVQRLEAIPNPSSAQLNELAQERVKVRAADAIASGMVTGLDGRTMRVDPATGQLVGEDGAVFEDTGVQYGPQQATTPSQVQTTGDSPSATKPRTIKTPYDPFVGDIQVREEDGVLKAYDPEEGKFTEAAAMRAFWRKTFTDMLKQGGRTLGKEYMEKGAAIADLIATGTLNPEEMFSAKLNKKFQREIKEKQEAMAAAVRADKRRNR